MSLLQLRLTRGTKVSLAEDDADARAAISEMLRITGYTFLEAVDGDEAVRVLDDEKRDVINLLLLDVRMPRKNGREACGEDQEDTQGY